MKKHIKHISAYILLAVTLFTGCEDQAQFTAEPISTAAESIAAEHSVYEKPAQAVGVNFNGQFDFIDYDNLERCKTTWVRGFVDFFQFYPDVEKLHNDPRLLKYLELKSNGYKTILNIKWNFSDKSFPEPESAEMNDYKQFLRKLLGQVWMQTDIIVVGNEPFIESRKEERDERLVAFYKEVAREVNAFKKGQGVGIGDGKAMRDVPIYIGAMNNLYLPGWRTPAVEQLLAFAESESWITGIDLHIHHGGIRQLNQAMDYVHDKIRDDQKIIITEYSLMKHWKSKMGESIPEIFAEKYGRDKEEQNYQYIDFALKNPVSREEWVDFLSSSYWFENRTKYLWNSYQRFKSYDKFHVATYAIRQSYPFNRDFTRTTDPWVLNGLYANRTVESDPITGLEQFNYAWIEDFLAIQNDQNN